ncbi:7-carboxy-7-deazaguanine synthase QueE [bacterium]|nr:7-carboxy-7-deazaguanine synthase QueE [bacterium]
MATVTKINEIFSSIQGEGPVVGYKQLFIRFCNCNLHCNYCDTEFLEGEIFTPEKLYEKITRKYELKNLHSISLTGGEPLLSVHFLKEFLPLIKDKTKVYLETNATMTQELNQVKDYIDIIAADIKLPSSSGMNLFDKHNDFLSQCKGIQTFVKIVFDNNITEEEIDFCISMGTKYDIELILQPKMNNDSMSVSSDFCQKILDKFLQKYQNVRLIPQVHKFIEIR